MVEAFRAPASVLVIVNPVVFASMTALSAVIALNSMEPEEGSSEWGLMISVRFNLTMLPAGILRTCYNSLGLWRNESANSLPLFEMSATFTVIVAIE